MKKLLVILSLIVTLLFGLNTNLKATTIKNEVNSQTQLVNQIETKVNKYGGYLNISSNNLKKVMESVYFCDYKKANQLYKFLNGYIQIIKDINNKGGLKNINIIDLRTIVYKEISFDNGLANNVLENIQHKMITRKRGDIIVEQPLGKNPVKDFFRGFGGLIHDAIRSVNNTANPFENRLSIGYHGNYYYCNFFGQGCSRNSFEKIYIKVWNNKHHRNTTRRRLFYFKNDGSLRENIGFWYRIAGPRHHKKRVIMYSTGLNGMYLNEQHKINHHMWYFGFCGYGHKQRKYVK